MFKFFNSESLVRLSKSELEALLAHYKEELTTRRSPSDLPSKIQAVKTALKLKCEP